MKLRHFCLLSTLFVLIIAVFVPIVQATWIFTDASPNDVREDITLGMNEFYYKPEEVLPGDGEATDLHENHYNLVTNIVDHVTYGLNATSKPIVRELLEDGAGVVYSNQNVQGGNLKHMLLDSSDVEDLMFVVEYVTATEYNAYTFSGNSATYSNMGKFITVYSFF